LTQDSIHSQIGLIPQDPTLFHRSLRENIRYGHPQATEEELDAATQQARAAVLQIVHGGARAWRTDPLEERVGPPIAAGRAPPPLAGG
jgi:ABC-type transport system involved in cytochrome bd biosynthesis fused ATPase/permease subunit